MYEKFLERNTNCISHTVDDGFIAQYAGIAPESLIALWKEAGLGMFCDGLFRIINPDEFQSFAEEYNSDSSNKTVLPFMATAFGDIFAYVDNTIVGDYVMYINVRYGTEKILSNNITLLLNKCVFNKSILEAWFKVENSIHMSKDIFKKIAVVSDNRAISKVANELSENFNILDYITLQKCTRMAYVLYLLEHTDMALQIASTVENVTFTNNYNTWTWIEQLLVLKSRIERINGNTSVDNN